mgnify:CR=1 FL=1
MKKKVKLVIPQINPDKQLQPNHHLFQVSTGKPDGVLNTVQDLVNNFKVSSVIRVPEDQIRPNNIIDPNQMMNTLSVKDGDEEKKKMG